ncbi:MAG: DUF924 domain-containing protein [Gammaproteobacteria bacterium]|nr:DUF924 domain-containing protein [Gammaproteobacteria bacterium]
MDITPEEIITFWFSNEVKNHWFSSTPALDSEIRHKYEALWKKAVAGKLDDWGNNSTGSLALVLILDQFPLNMYRNLAISFSSERKAVEITCNAINKNLDRRLDYDKRAFLYMPLMHSEELEKQDLSVKMYRDNHLKNSIDFAEHHREIVRKFGRFPHRNRILGRESTEEELLYLSSEHAFLG